jgi:hypothetical protein
MPLSPPKSTTNSSVLILPLTGGSFGFFGPLTIRPDLWDRGVGKRLMQPVVECFDKWQTKHAGLFTFAHSQKHIGLYQKFGFWPRFLTAIMSKPIGLTGSASVWTKFSKAPTSDRGAIRDTCRELTDAIYEGLDVGHEIRAVADQKLGDTVLLWNGAKLAGFAVCRKPEAACAISSLARRVQEQMRRTISAACSMLVKNWLLHNS